MTDLDQNFDPSGVLAARLAAIVESSDDVIVSKTLDGVITSWNPAAERMFGWTSDEAIGRHITLIVPDDRRAEEEEVLARLRRGERVDHFETVRRTKDGRLIDMSITVSPIRDASGRIVGASKIGRDITERRRLDEARARMLQLEQEARIQAETLNRTKDQLLATVSHELRTPLNAVFGWARVLQSVELDEDERARAVKAIIRSASAQARLVEDLLDLSRIVTGRLRLDVQMVDLAGIIEGALEAVRPAADAKEITLTVSGRLPATVLGAPDRLQQIMWNLLMNAVKFTPHGGHVQVSMRGAAHSVEVVVADTGEGVAPDLLPHIFELFRQEDSSSTRAHGGLGLGLALVRHLVQLHGGTVRAESPGKGRGSTFTVALPVRRSLTTGGAASDDSGDSVLEGFGSSLKNVRVLLVDDDVESLDMTTLMLRSAGAEVRAVSSAFRAYEVVNSWRPDVVLTDLSMPQEDGFMLLRALRETFAQMGAKVPIIAVTAYATQENRGRALASGFDLYLTKPVDPFEMTKAIAGLL